MTGFEPSTDVAQELRKDRDRRNRVERPPRVESLLRACVACEGPVSVDAAACPRCGHPAGGPERSTARPGGAGNVLAAVLSFFIPGLGQLCQGRAGAGLGFFVLAVLFWLVLLGWVVAIVAAVEAAVWRGQRT